MILFGAFQVAGAVSIAPEIVERLKQSGQLQTIVRADRQARERGVWQAHPDPNRFGNAATDVDTLHCLIILVDFIDMQHEWVVHSEPGDFDTLLFSTGITYPGSMTDYYFETSYNQAFLVGQVTQWLRMPQAYAYYVDGQRGFGQYPHNAQRLAEDAVSAADPSIDFSVFDNDGDGWVDALFVVHAGPGYEDTGDLNYIHSHAWVLSNPMTVDGVQAYSYSMEPEETAADLRLHDQDLSVHAQLHPGRLSTGHGPLHHAPADHLRHRSRPVADPGAAAEPGPFISMPGAKPNLAGSCRPIPVLIFMMSKLMLSKSAQTYTDFTVMESPTTNISWSKIDRGCFSTPACQATGS